jgi:hypothetical protein
MSDEKAGKFVLIVFGQPVGTSGGHAGTFVATPSPFFILH